MKKILFVIPIIFLFSCEKIQWELDRNNPNDAYSNNSDSSFNIETYDYLTNRVKKLDSTMFEIKYHILEQNEKLTGNFVDMLYSNRTNYIVISIKNKTSFKISNCRYRIIESNIWISWNDDDYKLTSSYDLSWEPYQDKVIWKYDENRWNNLSNTIRVSFPGPGWVERYNNDNPHAKVLIEDQFGNVVEYIINMPLFGL